MGCFSGPKTVNDGLVFHVDVSNTQKSWKGAPATNLFTETNLINWSKSALVELVNIKTPFDNDSYSITDNVTNNYLSITRNVTVPNDTASYTIGVMIRKTYGASSARLGFNSGFNTGGTTVAVNQRFNSDTGVATHGTSIDFGDWWYWYFTITNNGSGNTNLYVNFYPATGFYNGSDNSGATGTAIIGEMMLVAGSTAARFVNGSRANTQVMFDLANNNIITANSVIYYSNNTFSFDGTTSRFTTTNSTYSANSTWEAVINCEESVNTFNMFMGQWPPYISFYNGNRLYFSNQISNVQRTIQTPANMTTNKWYHAAFVATYDSASNNTVMSIYTNGVQTATGTFSGVPNNHTNLTIGDGRTNSWYPFKGKVDIVKKYNRELTAAEISQNFEAIRSRYGI